MTISTCKANSVVIGGGFYGAAIAIFLARKMPSQKVILLEQEPSLLTRASYNNQARVHNGYHYPRSFTTAYRSRVNLPKFLRDWPQAVKTDFTKLYAVASQNSHVTAQQFKRFCHQIGARIHPADQHLRALFESRLIEDVFLVEEYAFDSTQLAEWARNELAAESVDVRLATKAIAVSRDLDSRLRVTTQDPHGEREEIACRHVLNCTYSGLNQFHGDFSGVGAALKHEVTEMALMDVPPVLENVGITVMDGAFFSVMPFPARHLHTLSHVRYTPHFHWRDEPGRDPYRVLAEYEKTSRVDRMLRSVGRYVPAVLNARYVESLFEVKTVLVKSEGDDGRPILFEKHRDLPGCYSILGGKIDNIYDVLERIDGEITG